MFRDGKGSAIILENENVIALKGFFKDYKEPLPEELEMFNMIYGIEFRLEGN